MEKKHVFPLVYLFSCDSKACPREILHADDVTKQRSVSAVCSIECFLKLFLEKSREQDIFLSTVFYKLSKSCYYYNILLSMNYTLNFNVRYFSRKNGDVLCSLIYCVLSKFKTFLACIVGDASMNPF